jgi:hypothetical protein
MRGLRIALGACMLFTATAQVAQPLAPQPALPPNVRTIPPVRRAVPGTPPRFPLRPNRRFNAVPYPVFIDGSWGNRYLVAPEYSKPRKPSNNGEDVFETHSTNDALYAR